MTVDKAIVNLRKAFEYGQSYVALSRVRSKQGLSLDGPLTAAEVRITTVTVHHIHSYRNFVFVL
jgi:hypothetical protein